MTTSDRQGAGASLPVVDISGLRGGADSRGRVAADIHAACLDKGFMYVTGHGVPQRLIDAAFDMSRQFFALPLATKTRYDLSNAIARRGYMPIRTQSFDPDAPPDLKESFFLGVELPESDPRVQRRLYDHGPNQWPTEVPGFRAVMEDYHRELAGLAEALMEALALSLSLPEDYFAPFNRDPMVVIRLLYYPVAGAESPDGEKSFGAHTDFGALTLLAQDDSGGLEIQEADGSWIAATPMPGAFVVNLGDFVARWTNDRYRSTVHRVISTGRDRYSIACFFDGNPEYRVDCIPTCLAEGETPRYDPITMLGYLEQRSRKSVVAAAS